MSCLKDVHIGMKVEVINDGTQSFHNSENATFWVATVIKFKHFKTLLRYEGYDDDDRADFWFDLRCKDIHPVGWCARINKPLIPPQGMFALFSSLVFLGGLFFWFFGGFFH